MKSPQQCDAMRVAESVVKPHARVSPNSSTRHVRSTGSHRYLTILLTVGGILSVLVSWLSLSEIISPGPEPQLPQAIGAQPPSTHSLTQPLATRTPSTGQDSPLGGLGVIAGGCMVFSFLLSRKIRHR